MAGRVNTTSPIDFHLMKRMFKDTARPYSAVARRLPQFKSAPRTQLRIASRTRRSRREEAPISLRRIGLPMNGAIYKSRVTAGRGLPALPLGQGRARTPVRAARVPKAPFIYHDVYETEACCAGFESAGQFI